MLATKIGKPEHEIVSPVGPQMGIQSRWVSTPVI